MVQYFIQRDSQSFGVVIILAPVGFFRYLGIQRRVKRPNIVTFHTAKLFFNISGAGVIQFTERDSIASAFCFRQYLILVPAVVGLHRCVMLSKPTKHVIAFTNIGQLAVDGDLIDAGMLKSLRIAALPLQPVIHIFRIISHDFSPIVISPEGFPF